ncbi:MAG TPA: protein ImuA [Allosphingosinicella sp.]|uniref:ImuA family protein n=1 Tax=Allosphingosinicella sp. TaxID=2823234 RepID=UPI002EDB2B6A
MSAAPPSNAERLAALRAEVRAIEATGASAERLCLPFGIDEMDRRLAGGGLPVAALHEVSGERPLLGDDGAALLFLAGIAARRQGEVLWALARRDLFAPALAQAGLAPSRILYAECRSDEEVLAVMEEGLRHGCLGAVIGEVVRADMTATRRLQLAAETSGTTAFLLKRGRKKEADPIDSPSAAVTRWRIGCVPSGALPEVGDEGIGRARWRLTLARQRGGAPFTWIMEASDAEGRLALPAQPRHRPAAVEFGWTSSINGLRYAKA